MALFVALMDLVDIDCSADLRIGTLENLNDLQSSCFSQSASGCLWIAFQWTVRLGDPSKYVWWTVQADKEWIKGHQGMLLVDTNIQGVLLLLLPEPLPAFPDPPLLLLFWIVEYLSQYWVNLVMIIGDGRTAFKKDCLDPDNFVDPRENFSALKAESTFLDIQNFESFLHLIFYI